MWTSWVIGFAAALLVTGPLAWLLARRAARRARLLEARTLHAERLAELGSLTGGLAHEIRNPLATLRLNLQMLGEDWERADSSSIADLRRRSVNKLITLRRETERLDDILEDFLRYAGRHELQLEPVDVNRVVGELLDFYGPQASAAHVRIRPGLTPGPLIARLDVDLFKQALLNLLINAQQAMIDQGGGDLIVRTLGSGGQACIEVADTGPGIEPDRLGKVFQAYYSTKRGGTGLGLPTTRRIVQELGGGIDLHSEPGRGTSFTIRLPLAEE